MQSLDALAASGTSELHFTCQRTSGPTLLRSFMPGAQRLPIAAAILFRDRAPTEGYSHGGLSSGDGAFGPPLDRPSLQLQDHARHVALRFSNGHFTMIGLQESEGRPLMRAYSIASANYEEHLEFLSIKVERRAADLTSPAHPARRFPYHRQKADRHAAHRITCCRASGSIFWRTGTGLAPFLSIVRDPETYDRNSNR